MGILSVVDPYETVIKAAQGHAALVEVVNNRIADRHRYGQDTGDWEQDKQGLTISGISGAVPDLDLPIHNVALTASCFGDTFPDAEKVLIALRDFTRRSESITVPINGGLALLYRIIFTSSPTKIVLDEVRPGGGMPAYVVTMRAEVADEFC